MTAVHDFKDGGSVGEAAELCTSSGEYGGGGSTQIRVVAVVVKGRRSTGFGGFGGNNSSKF